MKKGYIGVGVLIVVIVIGLIYFSQRETGLVVDEGLVVTNEYMDVTSFEAKELIMSNPDLIIIDVSPNYDMGHLPGAINYYVGDGSLDEAIPTLDSMGTYLVYCHFDSASRAGAQKLVDAGFESVYRLTDHFSGWVDAGYSVEY